MLNKDGKLDHLSHATVAAAAEYVTKGIGTPTKFRITDIASGSISAQCQPTGP